jgi:cell division protein FtsB
MKLLETLNESGIPKFFWYTISFCLLMVVFFLMWIAYKSQTVNIEIASTKIQLVSSIREVEDAYSALKLKDEAMKAANALLEEENKSLKKQLASLNVPTATRPSFTPTTLPAFRTEALEHSISNLKNARQVIEKQ